MARLSTIRAFLAFQAVVFWIASAIHAGWIVPGFEHREARIAESVIGTVLLVALALTWLAPARARATALVAQGFALFATFVGIFTIVVGVGPRTLPDVAYHVAIVVVLLWGLTVAWGAREPAHAHGGAP